MTTHYVHRCGSCSRRYSYQGSGPGCGDRLNDAKYCPDCKALIVDALRNVKPKVERFRVVVEGEERERVLSEQKRKREEPPDEKNSFFGLKTQQIRPGLHKMDGRRVVATMHIEVHHLDGVEYDVSTWSDNHEPPKVEKIMERNLETGWEEPWRNFNNRGRG